MTLQGFLKPKPYAKPLDVYKIGPRNTLRAPRGLLNMVCINFVRILTLRSNNFGHLICPQRKKGILPLFCDETSSYLLLIIFLKIVWSVKLSLRRFILWLVFINLWKPLISFSLTFFIFKRSYIFCIAINWMFFKY